MTNLNKKEIIYSILVLTIPLLILFTTYFISRDNSKIIKTTQVEKQLEFKNNPEVFENIELTAKAAIIKDINTGEVLYAKNEDLSLPLASITKILTVLTFDNLIQKKVVDLRLNDLQINNKIVWNNQNFKAQDLIDMTLVVSSNSAAQALSANIISALPLNNSIDFIDEMNKLAQEIGMTRSRFYNETGLDENEKMAGAYGSANDIVKLFEYTLKNKKELFESTSHELVKVKSTEGFIYDAFNTNRIINELPNMLIGKTGTTDIAGGNLAVVIDPFLNKPFVIVVLGSTSDGRYEDVNLLTKKVIAYYKNDN